jgi:hypothetical protein
MGGDSISAVVRVGFAGLVVALGIRGIKVAWAADLGQLRRQRVKSDKSSPL